MDICIRTGRRIRLLRDARKMTQDSLAGYAGISREHLCELENGRKEAGIRMIEKIATGLDVRPNELLD